MTSILVSVVLGIVVILPCCWFIGLMAMAVGMGDATESTLPTIFIVVAIAVIVGLASFQVGEFARPFIIELLK